MTADFAPPSTDQVVLDERLVLRPPATRPERRPRPQDPPAPRSWNFAGDNPPMRHLARRFFQSLSRRPPSKASRAWAFAMLNAGERGLFDEMPNFDQRHAIGVAKLAYELTNDQLCARAALLHDVGKIDSRLGPVMRSIATLVKRWMPTTKDLWSRRWWVTVRDSPSGRSQPRGYRDRFAAYWMHPWTGRHMLEVAGADPFVAVWAEQHHQTFVAEDLVADWRQACVLWGADGD